MSRFVIDVGLSRIQVDARREFGQVILGVYEWDQAAGIHSEAHAVLPWSTAQAFLRSLDLAVRLSAVSDRRGDCPAWCDPYNHRANYAPHTAAVGEFYSGNQTVNVDLYQRPGGQVLVGLFVSLAWNCDAFCDMPPDTAATLARQLDAAMEPDPRHRRQAAR